MGGFVGCIPRFLKAHGGWVLTGFGLAGLLGTVILTANEAPKAQEALKEADSLKFKEWLDENVCPEESLDPEDFDAQWDENLKNAGEFPGLTWWEKVKVAAPIYLPAILTGTVTAGCFVGSQIFNMKQQAILVGAYATLATQFDQYREAVKAEHGEEADKRAFEISRMKIEELKAEIERLKEENGPYLYGITTLPGIVFEASPVDVQESLYHFNRNLVLRGEADFDELYSFIGIPDTVYDEARASSFGYNDYINEVNYGVRYADFDIRSVFTEGGRPVNMICPVITPYRIDCIDTDDENLGSEDQYPDYEMVEKRAFDLAKSIGASCFSSSYNPQLTKIEHKTINAPNFYSEKGTTTLVAM